MAYDKAIDSTYLNLGLSEIADKIREKGGTTDMLTFPDDFVTAIDAIEGSGETVMQNILYEVSAEYTTGTAPIAYYNQQTCYRVYTKSADEWTGLDGAYVELATVANLTNRYITGEGKLFYCHEAVSGSFSPTVYIYDMSADFDSYEKTPVGTHNGEYPIGTYEFKDGKVYYYGQEKQEKYATVTITSTCNGINGDTSHIIITSPEAFAPDSSNPSNTVTTWTVWCYDMPDCTINLPKGSKIKCFVSDTKANNRGYVSINGENVLEGNGNYTYAVTQNIAIDVSDAYDQGEYGKITITE